jgi:ABC-type multidrug transport system ATPase subunit
LVLGLNGAGKTTTIRMCWACLPTQVRPLKGFYIVEQTAEVKKASACLSASACTMI